MNNLKTLKMVEKNNSMITREEIEEKVVENVTDSGIRKTDIKKGLECFCSDNPPMNDFEKKIRGYIFEDNTLILKSLSYADVYDNSDNIDISNFSASVMMEGTSVRVFYHNDEWFITTHRKIDAFKSKWGKESFGDIFEKNILLKTGLSVNQFCETLDKKLSYVFLVGTTETTRVVAPSFNNVTLLNCMNKKSEIVEDPNFIEWYPKKLEFQNVEEAVKYSEEFKYPFKNGHGVFLFSENKSYKIINEEYKKLSDLRNNLPSIHFAYLHNVFNPDNNKLFRKIYSSFESDFNYYDSEISAISDDLLIKYIRRFVRKENIMVSKQEHNILYHIHGIFLDSKKIIKKDDVIKAFSLVPISNLNKIISERKHAKKLLEKQTSDSPMSSSASDTSN